MGGEGTLTDIALLEPSPSKGGEGKERGEVRADLDLIESFGIPLVGNM